ncbi:hypothetical protein [Xanthobacter sp. YC-JY1]|uniref:hypothetical protein n=1 Tax=Xanthobacter sp. YC-JY1 TaxID=2419844 RepID=UPI001F32D318|nr:hypothetical protein [Xanthobacter sp. YC-JY1]
MEESDRLCVIFDAHRQVGSELLTRTYNRIASVFEKYGDVFAVFDGSRPPGTSFLRTVELSRAEIFDSIPHSKGDFLIPGNVDLKIIAATTALQDYNNFIRIEFDVWPCDIADERAADLCDLARSNSFSASFIRNGHHDPEWMYWPTLRSPDNSIIDIDDRYAAFLPLMTFNRQFIDFYAASLCEGWTGHYEALMPTLARKSRAKLVDLSSPSLNFTCLNEFNVTPQCFEAPISGAFVHPVKDLNQISRIEAPYLSQIVATPAEISEIANYLKDCDHYLEFGAGGTTPLACHSGAQRITSIETDLNFCTDIIKKYSLRKFIDTGRLHLRHAFVGPTGKWGFPLNRPTDRQIENYISWPTKESSADLILIDGRFRVSVAADAAISCRDDATIMIHDYFDRPQYSVVEEFLQLDRRIDSLAIFHPMADKRDVALQRRKDYFYRMD